tara:strand:+ start:671 stop:1675 length:1005 start_codon:yes stop_codon:yes gene_type:complete
MSIDKKINYEIQGGVKNYRPSEMVTAPRIAKSSPDTPTAKLAYITPAEEKILIDLNLYGSLNGKPNRGPSGLPSLEGDFGGGFGGFRGGGDYSSAETGNFSGFDGTPKGPELPPGVDPKPSKDALDIRSSFIAAGGGQRVNPGFFDSRNVVSPIELARAKAFNPAAFGAGRAGGIMDFLTSGGVIGNLIRGLGQRFGFGKTYDQPTYDMSRLSGLPLGGTATFENLDIRDKFDRTTDDDDSEIVDKYNEYLIDGPPNPLTFKEFKNAIESIQKGTLPNTTTSMLPTTLVADTKVNNKNILRNLFNPKLNLNEAIDKEDEKQKRQEDLLEEIMKA